jgi:hypothetical protein
MIPYQLNETKQVPQEGPHQATVRGLQQMAGKVTRRSACDPLERELYSDEDIRVKT